MVQIARPKTFQKRIRLEGQEWNLNREKGQGVRNGGAF